MRYTPFALAAALCLCAAPLHAQPLGMFDGAVQGRAGRTAMSGTAVACVSDSDPGAFTFIILQESPETEVMMVFGSPAPPPGEYDLGSDRRGVNDGPSASLYRPREDGRRNVYMARSGTLRLADASASQLQGTVEFAGPEIADFDDSVRVTLRFTAERIGEMTEGNCVRPPAGTTPLPSASAALARTQPAPGTATLAIRAAQGIATHAGTVDFCRWEAGLDLTVAVEGGRRLLVSGVPPRPGRFVVGTEDVFVSLSTGAESEAWTGATGYVRITSLTTDRVQGSLETDVYPAGGGFVQMGAVFDAPVSPRCSGQ